MSTIKSSSENLTLNADGSGNDVLIQSNGSTKAIVTAEGTLGIGTASPTTSLHLKDNATAANTKLTVERSALSYTGSYAASHCGSVTNNEFEIHTNNTLRVKIDNTGAVTMPAQPAFSAKPSSTQSDIAVGSQITVVFGTEIFDQNSDFSSNTFTAPVTGRYQLNLSMYINRIDKDSSFYIVCIKTSNREYECVIDPGVLESDPVYWHQQVSGLADMDANDTAYIFVHQGSGAAQTDITNSTIFSGYLAC